MIRTKRATGGMVVAPHHLAAEAGRDVLREGGTAIEATVATAAAMGVLYPHMNGLGGDGFWLISHGQEAPTGIMGAGPAGQRVDRALYRALGLDAIPTRGPLAANTVAADVATWRTALAGDTGADKPLPLARLLEPAIHYAKEGFPLSRSQAENTAAKMDQMTDVPGFAGLFLIDGTPPPEGAVFRNTRLAETLRQLAKHGLEDFYRGNVARMIAHDLERAGSPLVAQDMDGYQAAAVAPLSVPLSSGRIYQLPPPTQGLAALIILALYDRMPADTLNGFDHVHRLVEATRLAFEVRDGHITDPAFGSASGAVDPAAFLTDDALDAMAARIDPARTGPDACGEPGDTVWIGAADVDGTVVSYIHTLYWEFGSGVVLEDSGIVWQNRGTSFSLDDAAVNRLEPGRLPFHTNVPAMALLPDGRVMAYGTMGGDGQPQTQAAVYTRHVMGGEDLQRSITQPRWLLGRTWGDPVNGLRIEDDPAFWGDTVARLEAAGHRIILEPVLADVMGHAGAVVRRTDGVLEGASDPRSDGAASGY